MDQLPTELIEKILCSNNLNIEDVVNFASTCTRLRNMIFKNSAVWKHKYCQYWPHLIHFFDTTSSDFLKEIKYIYFLKKQVIMLLETMSPRFYRKYQLSESDFNDWVPLVQERKFSYYYITSYLEKIISCNYNINSIEVVPLNTPGNKTLQYYARQVIRFIKHQHLTNVWAEFEQLHPKKQLLEKGAIFVAQWCQPDLGIAVENIQNELDSIAECVKKELYSINSKHPLFEASKDDLEKWRNENLEKSQWSIQHCRQIIAVMREVVFINFGFEENRERFYHPEIFFINKVLENRAGLPIVLTIIYEAVSRRLGLFLEPINFPAHFLLRYIEGDRMNQNVFYIDTFNGGHIIQKSVCPYSREPSRRDLFPAATACQVVERLAHNLELSTRQYIDHNSRVTALRTILELLLLVSSDDLLVISNLAKLYILHKIDTQKLESILIQRMQTLLPNRPVAQIQSILNMLHNSENFPEYIFRDHDAIEPVSRTHEVKYAVGMIMRNVVHDNRCLILGWSRGYTAMSDCPIMDQPHVNNKLNQPFYSVLVEDGSYRYVPQEALIPLNDAGNLPSNHDLGRHFSHFFGNHFVPNAEKEREYPEDKKIRQQFYHQAQLNHYVL